MEVLRSTAAAETGKKRNGGCRITSGTPEWDSHYVSPECDPRREWLSQSEGKQKKPPMQAIHEESDVTTAQVREMEPSWRRTMAANILVSRKKLDALVMKSWVWGRMGELWGSHRTQTQESLPQVRGSAPDWRDPHIQELAVTWPRWKLLIGWNPVLVVLCFQERILEKMCFYFQKFFVLSKSQSWEKQLPLFYIYYYT